MHRSENVERIKHCLDLLVVLIVFIASCLVGKLVIIYVADTWLAFNAPTLTVFIIGMLVWKRVRKYLNKIIENQID